MNPSKPSKNLLHCALNRLVGPTSVANTAFLLAMPINCTPVLSAHPQTVILVKVVNKAHVLLSVQIDVDNLLSMDALQDACRCSARGMCSTEL